MNEHSLLVIIIITNVKPFLHCFFNFKLTEGDSEHQLLLFWLFWQVEKSVIFKPSDEFKS